MLGSRGCARSPPGSWRGRPALSAMSAYSALALSLKLLMGFAVTMGECAEDANLRAAKWWKHMDYIDDDAMVIITRWGYREVGNSVEAIKVRAARCIVSVQELTESTASCQRLMDALDWRTFTSGWRNKWWRGRNRSGGAVRLRRPT